jgi:hypothetical protein
LELRFPCWELPSPEFAGEESTNKKSPVRVTLGFENTNDRAKHYRRKGCATSKLPRYKAIPRSLIGLCFVLDIEQIIELYFLIFTVSFFEIAWLKFSTFKSQLAVLLMRRSFRDLVH